MIPLRDINRTHRTPIVTWVLIALNVAAFALQFAGGREAVVTTVSRFGVVPEILVFGDWSAPRSAGGALGSWVTPVTSMFLHGGLLHLAGNMWFLHVFGDNVEDALGRAKFVVFYLVCGFAAVLAQIAVEPRSSVPMIGASGAISGVLAGYVWLFPRARVVTVVPIFILIHFMEVPAVVFIALWFVLQLVLGVVSLGTQEAGGVAWFAHVGGFVGGLLWMWLSTRTRRTRTFRR